MSWYSAGTAGFKGTKGTPFAAQLAAEQATKAMDQGCESEVLVRTSSGRDCYSVFAGRWFNHQLYKDVTPIPHNGCRPPKQRRV